VGTSHQAEEDEAEEHSQPSSSRGPSIAWTYFNKGPIVRPTDPTKKAWFYSECQECKREGKKVVPYKTEVGGGTRTLIRHLASAHGITRKGRLQQTQVQTQIAGFAEPGTGMPVRYTQDNMINEMADFVISRELPFTFGETRELERMNRRALNASYRPVNNDTLTRRTIKRFYKSKQKLINELANFRGRVCLTSDCWTCPHTHDSFMCVTVHWIDTNWVLQKRIIAFDLFNENHTGANICARVKSTMDEYKIEKKLFSISFDNATANNKCIEFAITNWPHLLLGGRLLHVRCCAHIINLSAQEGLQYLNPLLGPIKQCIYWIRNTRSIKRQYKLLRQQYKLPYVDWSADTPTRWDSTYYMLKKAIRSKLVITSLYTNTELNVPVDNDFNEYMWTVAGHCCNLLRLYKDN
jgi:hypothetical protein